MLRFYAGERAQVQSKLVYRGYDLEVRPAASGWRVGIYPRTASKLRDFCHRSLRGRGYRQGSCRRGELAVSLSISFLLSPRNAIPPPL
jgi:hypothetical protein